MHLMPAAMITGDAGVCASEPCWLGKNTRESLDLRQPGDTSAKRSKDSYAAVLVPGSTQHSSARLRGSTGDMIDERILRAIRFLSPDAYFFALEREATYEVVPAPSILAPD